MPCVCMFQFVLGFSIVSHSPVTYGTYQYPGWALCIGWFFALCSMLPLPGVLIYRLTKSEGPLFQVSKQHHHFIPTKPFHNHDIVSVHFNNFYCTEICDKLSRDLAMLTYIYISMWMTAK